ncbi:MAG: hypothetical protein Q9160_002737 [Pyrenula sp. 1 TL-2023]
MYKALLQLPPGDDIGIVYKSCKRNAPQTFQDAMAVREDVFCDEQGCSLLNELDEDDGRSWQWVFYDTEQHQRIGVIRLVPPPHHPHPNGFIDPDEEPYIKLTRIAVAKSFRGKGLGRALLSEALQWAVQHGNDIGNGWKGMVLIHAQSTVENMYQRLGFQTNKKLGQWDEEGILHIGMWKQIDIRSAK